VFVVVSRGVFITALPETPPKIHTERDRYEPGDILRANCSSSPSKPSASLSFFINNIPVSTGLIQGTYSVTSDEIRIFA
jgi:hypothetical protein